MKIVISLRARGDLGDIWRFGAGRWSNAQADRYAERCFAAIGALADNPLSGARVEWSRAGHRRIAVGSHLVFYRVTHEEVIISRVLHQSRDAGQWVE